MLVSLWTCSLSIMNVRTLESRCCLPAGYQRKTHKWKRAREPRILQKPAAAAAAEAERDEQVRRPARRLHGFYLSGDGERNIFQHLRGRGELLLTHLVSWFNARLNTPLLSIMHGMSLIHQNSSLRLISRHQHGTGFLVRSLGWNWMKERALSPLGPMYQSPRWQSSCFPSVSVHF